MDTRVNLEGRPVGAIPLDTILGVVDWFLLELEACLVNDREMMPYTLEPFLGDLILLTTPTNEETGDVPWLGSFQLTEEQAEAVRSKVTGDTSRLLKLYSWRWRQRGDLSQDLKAHLAIGIASLRWNCGERFDTVDPRLQESSV